MNLFLSIKWHWTNSVLPTATPPIPCADPGAREGEGPSESSRAPWKILKCSIEGVYFRIWWDGTSAKSKRVVTVTTLADKVLLRAALAGRGPKSP